MYEQIDKLDARKLDADDIRHLIQDIADEADGEVYEGYSGRRMYGAECWGVTCDNALRVVEAAARYGLTGAEFDSMGRGYVVYWRKLRIAPPPAPAAADER